MILPYPCKRISHIADADTIFHLFPYVFHYVYDKWCNSFSDLCSSSGCLFSVMAKIGHHLSSHTSTGCGIKIYHISKVHCGGCSRGREVGVVSCGWLASTVFGTHNGLDRWIPEPLCCWSVLWEQPFCDSEAESVLYTSHARSKRSCDFFFGGYLKEKVFKHSLPSPEDVKERIQQEIDSIPPELTQRVMKNFRGRLQQCVANDGRRMSDITFKTH